MAEDECPKHSDAAALPFCTDSCPCAGELCKGKVEGGGADTCGAASDADNCREKTAQGAMLDVGVYRVTSTFYADRAGCDNKCWREPDPVKETPQPTRMPASVDYAPTYSPTNEDGSCMRPLSHGPPPDGWTSDDCDDYVDRRSGIDVRGLCCSLQDDTAGSAKAAKRIENGSCLSEFDIARRSTKTRVSTAPRGRRTRST